MTFIWPMLLWGVALVPVVVWLAVRTGIRERKARTRLADDHLIDRVVDVPYRRRRRASSALYLAALLLLLVGAGRPVASIPLPTNRATVMLAIDTSQSMMGDDIKPSRLEAAKAEARAFVRGLPGGVRVGLIGFSDTGMLLAPPSTGRVTLEEALDRLRPQQSTAIGAAIVEGLFALPGRREFLGERLERLRGQATPDPFGRPPLGGPPSSGVPPTPPSVEDLPPGMIVLFSDGVANAGVDPTIPAALAADARVKVHTVAAGSGSGAVMRWEGRLVLVPFAPSVLQALAQRTGGEHLRLGDAAAMRRIGEQFGRSIGWEHSRTEMTALFAAAAGVLVLTGAGLSMAWFGRVP